MRRAWEPLAGILASMPEVVVNGFLMGTPYLFDAGVTPTPVPVLVPPTDRELMEMRIAGATGHDRYTERLAETDLRKVIYVYGTKDISVGGLTEDEVGFLESGGATVIAIQDGSHTSMFDNADAAQGISDALQE